MQTQPSAQSTTRAVDSTCENRPLRCSVHVLPHTMGFCHFRAAHSSNLTQNSLDAFWVHLMLLVGYWGLEERTASIAPCKAHHGSRHCACLRHDMRREVRGCCFEQHSAAAGDELHALHMYAICERRQAWCSGTRRQVTQSLEVAGVGHKREQQVRSQRTSPERERPPCSPPKPLVAHPCRMLHCCAWPACSSRAAVATREGVQQLWNGSC